MRAVMLAAGDGGRLAPYTDHRPKPLVEIGGRPLIAYTLEGLAAAAIDEVVVVTGYRERQVVQALLGARAAWPPLRFVSNPDFARGASYSLRAARPELGEEPFLLVMSDHLLGAGLLRRLLSAALAGPPGRSYVAADACGRDATYTAEATRLRLDGERRVREIGKGLRSWSAFDTGAFYVHPSAWAAFERAPRDCELSALFGPLVAAGALFAADVSGEFWYDVDTVADLEAAARLLAGAVVPARDGGVTAAG